MHLASAFIVKIKTDKRTNILRLLDKIQPAPSKKFIGLRSTICLHSCKRWHISCYSSNRITGSGIKPSSKCHLESKCGAKSANSLGSKVVWNSLVRSLI